MTVLAASAQAQTPDASDWGHYGGNTFGQHYSTLTQIERANVARLEQVWVYRTGELGQHFASADELAFEATPVLAFGLLYLATPTNVVIALDPLTGRERWRHDPRIDRTRRYAPATSRGVTVWRDPDPWRTGPCAERVFAGTLDARLLALDAATGKPCPAFGTGGTLDLASGLPPAERTAFLLTSPPVVHGQLVIVGSAAGRSGGAGPGRGIVRAFEARTGAPRWSFDPAGAGASAWAVMSLDPSLGSVFVPTGSASPAFGDAGRSRPDGLASSLLALDAASGKLQWHRQLVHRDLWDFDLAAQPALVELDIGRRTTSAVVQATRTGMLFVFDRASGEPVVPIVERPVPASTLAAATTSPTQPFSLLPPLVSHRPIDPDDAWGITFWDRGRCRERIAKHRSEGVFTPPDTRGSILMPGDAGGVSWGGVAFDAERQRIIAAVNHLPMLVTLVPPRAADEHAGPNGFPRADVLRLPGLGFAMRRAPLVSPWGLPCTAPPWGTLASVDLRRNRIVWQVPLGSTEGYGPWFAPARDFGMPHRGGPIVTAGGLVFVAAAMDGYFRAFDVETGRELWKRRLPAGGQATPMTYRAGATQRQFVVIAAGGHGGLGTRRGDYVVAFALPED